MTPSTNETEKEMKHVSLVTLGPNRTELRLGNGTIVFFSYDTPVAAMVNGVEYCTNKKYSVTTSKHINQWLIDKNAAIKEDPRFFQNLLDN